MCVCVCVCGGGGGGGGGVPPLAADINRLYLVFLTSTLYFRLFKCETTKLYYFK